jgi:hypothetical protein
MKNSLSNVNYFLLFAGVLSTLAALLHVAIIVGGADWYRFFGAGEEMASMVEAGSLLPAFVIFGIAVVLSAWALYAFSGAGVFRRLPLLRPALIVISLIYLVRGLGIIPVYYLTPNKVNDFLLWSSLLSIVYGLSYAIGIGLDWKGLGERRKGERRKKER